jgi:hypothetical protein
LRDVPKNIGISRTTLLFSSKMSDFQVRFYYKKTRFRIHGTIKCQEPKNGYLLEYQG